MFELLAQTTGDSTLRDIMTIGGPLGVGGILVWHLWYRTSVADPKKDEENRKERTEERAAFRSTLDTIVERFDNTLTAEREHREREARDNRDRFRCPVIEQRLPPPNGRGLQS